MRVEITIGQVDRMTIGMSGRQGGPDDKSEGKHAELTCGFPGGAILFYSHYDAINMALRILSAAAPEALSPTFVKTAEQLHDAAHGHPGVGSFPPASPAGSDPNPPLETQRGSRQHVAKKMTPVEMNKLAESLACQIFKTPEKEHKGHFKNIGLFHGEVILAMVKDKLSKRANPESVDDTMQGEVDHYLGRLLMTEEPERTEFLGTLYATRTPRLFKLILDGLIKQLQVTATYCKNAGPMIPVAPTRELLSSLSNPAIGDWYLSRPFGTFYLAGATPDRILIGVLPGTDVPQHVLDEMDRQVHTRDKCKVFDRLGRDVDELVTFAAPPVTEPQCTCGALRDIGSAGHSPTCPRNGMD